MTMHAEYVKTGAAASRRASTKNPMEILANMRDADPTAGFEYQFAKWRKAVERDEETNKAALLHAFRNYWTALDREATFAEVRKEGGLFVKIGKLGKPSQVVGKVLTEAQLQKLWR